jgi:hypothetical protein
LRPSWTLLLFPQRPWWLLLQPLRGRLLRLQPGGWRKPMLAGQKRAPPLRSLLMALALALARWPELPLPG